MSSHVLLERNEEASCPYRECTECGFAVEKSSRWRSTPAVSQTISPTRPSRVQLGSPKFANQNITRNKSFRFIRKQFETPCRFSRSWGTRLRKHFDHIAILFAEQVVTDEFRSFLGRVVKVNDPRVCWLKEHISGFQDLRRLSFHLKKNGSLGYVPYDWTRMKVKPRTLISDEFDFLYLYSINQLLSFDNSRQ